MIEFATAAIATFIFCLIAVPTILGLLRAFGLYAIVEEGTCHVYVLFGNVVGILREPGLYFLPVQLGLAAFVVNRLERRHVLDMRLDQKYLRSQPVNSEEGAPMGVGIWYEYKISDPIAYLFKNADPDGSLAANVSNAVVRTLSNLPLADMLENRHAMSRAVRDEVSPKSAEWGYQLGSVYIRKVHFRDIGMIRQIEEKVVNRLRQVTAAIKQDGANQVSIITNSAERQAAIEFARAQAIRPQIVGTALNKIAADPEVSAALFEILELQNIIEGRARVTLIPPARPLLQQINGSDPCRRPSTGTARKIARCPRLRLGSCAPRSWSCRCFNGEARHCNAASTRKCLTVRSQKFTIRKACRSQAWFDARLLMHYNHPDNKRTNVRKQ